MNSTFGEPELGPCPHCGEHHPEDQLICPKTDRTLPLRGRLLDGKFRLVAELGEGGMGMVWKAENILVHKSVALKLMHAQFARQEATLNRFRNEATAAGRIGNDYICDILDLGQSSLGPYIVMEMLKGRSLGELLDDVERIEPGLAVLIMRQALEGLEAAHRVGIVHRDLKPENVFLHEPQKGRLMVKLMDFGISKFSDGAMGGQTGVGVLMGTPEYMSPEQAEGAANVDARTDLWAMGVIMYRALTGVNPFIGNNLASTLVNLSTKEPQPIRTLAPAVSDGLAAVINRCLAKEPDQRFASARELSAALAPFEEGPSATQVHQAAMRPATATTQGGTGAVTPPATAASVAAASAAAASASPPGTGTGSTVAAGSAARKGPTWSSEIAGAGAQSQPTGPENSWAMGQAVPGQAADAERRTSPVVWLFIAVLIAGALTGTAWLVYKQVIVKGTTVAEGGETTGAVVAGETGAAAETGKAVDEAGDGKAEADEGKAAEEAGEADEGAAAEAGDTKDSADDGKSDETGAAGETGGADGGETGKADDGGGETGKSDEGGADEGDAGDGGDDGGSKTTGGTRPKGPKVDKSKVQKVGRLYVPTPDKRRLSTGWRKAKTFCAGLKAQRYAGLRGWRLASPKEVRRFKGTIENVKWWTNEKHGQTRAVTVNLGPGASGGVPEPFTTRARPLCVSRHK